LADPFSLSAARWAAPDYRRAVSRWAWDRLEVSLWSMQAEIADAVPTHKKTLVRSCHDSGKTFLAAVCSCHHLDTHPVGQARLITTAPTNTQVRGLLWNEINQLYGRAEEVASRRNTPGLPGRVNQTEWWIGTRRLSSGRCRRQPR
jgi:hypothetical protein